MIQNLAYLGFRSPNAEAWRTFGPEVIGATAAADGPDGSIRLRIDGRPWRLSVEPGERDELAFIGWDVADDAFDDTVAAIAAFGLEVAESDDLATSRHATRAATFSDPFGLRHELVAGIADESAFDPSPWVEGGFVTGAQGMGHLVLMVPSLDDADRFLTEALGLVLSDTIELRGQLRFYHCGGSAARHHALAISEVPGRIGVHHAMVELADPDDVGRSLDRARDAGHALAMDYGRHPNDGMTSFYVRTPSGFELEIGSGGVVIDDATWQVASFDAMSTWGHRPPADGPLRPGILTRLDSTGA